MKSDETVNVSVVGCGGNRAVVSERGDFMLGEIYRQPVAVLNTLKKWFDNTGRLVNDLGLSHRVRDLRRLHIVAGGSAYYAGLVGRYIIEKFARIPVSVDLASEYKYMEPATTKGTAMIVVSSHGGSDNISADGPISESLAALPFQVSMAQDRRPRIGLDSDALPVTSFMYLMATLCLFGISLGVEKGRLRRIEIETLKSLLEGLPGLISKALQTESKIREVVETLGNTQGFFYLGRGIAYPLALEGASMMKEVSHIHAEGFPAGEIRRELQALPGDATSVVLVTPIEYMDEELLKDIHQLKESDTRLIAITDAPAAFTGITADTITIPSCHPVLIPFITLVPLQLLAYHVAVCKGNGSWKTY